MVVAQQQQQQQRRKKERERDTLGSVRTSSFIPNQCFLLLFYDYYLFQKSRVLIFNAPLAWRKR